MSGIHELRAYCESIGCACHADEPMSRHTSFKIGGPADLLVRPADAETAAKVMRRAGELGVALTIIGRGSDLLVSDEGIRGAVLSFDEQAAKPGMQGPETIFCPAGASLTALCVFAWQRGLSGLEFAYGIPGSVGGAVYMNAGAYGGEMKDVLESVRCLTPEGGERVLGAAELELSYRHSWFTGRPGHLITGAAFRLQKGDPAAIRAKMDDLMERRKQKQPLEYPSGGSTFKRPAGSYASALIDRCGLKGRRVGGAMVSEKHAGFVINYDNATCRDVLALVELVQKEVQEKTGYTLECEIKLL